MGQSSNRSFVFLVTGNYWDDDGSNDISAVGFAGTVHAYGGNDRVLTASFYTKIEKSWGDLGVWGLNGGIDIRKSGDGSITTHGNTVIGGSGDDVIYAAGLINVVLAGDGNDVLFAFGGGSVLNGGSGNDVYLSQGMASRILQSKGLLNDCTAMIQTAIDDLNGATQSISSELAPDKVTDYEIQHSSGVIQDIAGNGSNVFYSGFEKSMVQAGSGDDRFHFYLGDAEMSLTSGTGRDHLYIHADMKDYSGYGLNTSFDSSNLYYQANTKTLSIYQNNLTYGKINLTDFDRNDTVTLLMSNGTSVDVLLSSLQSPGNLQNNAQYWSPTTPIQAESISMPNLASLYSQMKTNLTINAALL